MSEPDQEPDPIDEWLTRYDDALLRGETPPNLAGVEGVDVDSLRGFLDMLHRTLRPGRGGVPPTIPGGDDLDDEADEARPLEPIGRFILEEELGRGGFGIVYRAFDPTIGRRVALKVPRVDALMEPGVRRRFLREAQAAARLDHPNLVPVFEVGEVERVCYIASAYCEGPTLRAWLRENREPLAPRVAARLALSLARAIEHMHARGLTHCDLKPENVLLDLAPECEPTPRVTDFGLARLADAPVGESTAARAWGTPPYMAPEQIEMRRAEIGPATDVYALGAILYELLTGRPPHRGKTAWELMRAVVSEPPSPPRSLRRAIPRDLDAIAMKCLEKHPNGRYRDAAKLVDDLLNYLGGYASVARPLGRVRRLARWTARNPAAAALLALGAVTLAISLSYSLALRRAFDDLNRANGEARTARDLAQQHETQARDALARAESKTEEERRTNYVATLALARQEIDRGQLIQAQRFLRDLIPKEGDSRLDRRDFAWYYLWLQSRRECTVLDELASNESACVSAVDGMLLATRYEGRAGAWRITRPGGVSGSFRSERPLLTFRSLDLHGPGPFQRLTAPSDGRFGLGVCFERFKGKDQSTGEQFALSAVDLSDGSARGRLEGRGKVSAIAMSDDGNRVAIAFGLDGPSKLTARDWDFGAGKLQVIQIPYDNYGMITLIGDGRRIACQRFFSGPHCYLRIWDVSTARYVDVDTDIAPDALAVSPAPVLLIATGTFEGEVQLRDPIKGEILAVLPVPDGYRDVAGCRCLAFSPDGKTLAAGYSGMAILWDVERRRVVARIEGLQSRTSSITFLKGFPPDVAIGLTSGEVVVWHMEPIEPAVVLKGHSDQVWGVGYVDGGRTIATLAGEKLLKLWDATTDTELVSLPGHRDFPSCLAAATASSLIATGDFSGELLIWDAGKRQMVHRLKAHKDRVRAVAISADGRWVASGGRDRAVRLWDARSGASVGSMDGKEGSVRGLAFSPDGTLLASVCEDGPVRLWDLESHQEVRHLDASVSVSSLVWSPDGRLIAAGDIRGAVTIWDAQSGEVCTRLTNLHRQEVDGLAFSPDGRVLAAGGQDKIVTLIDVATGRRHLTLTGHEGGVNALAFSPDGRTLASASHDRTVRLWWAGASPDEFPEEMSRLPSPASGL